MGAAVLAARAGPETEAVPPAAVALQAVEMMVAWWRRPGLPAHPRPCERAAAAARAET